MGRKFTGNEEDRTLDTGYRSQEFRSGASSLPRLHQSSSLARTLSSGFWLLVMSRVIFAKPDSAPLSGYKAEESLTETKEAENRIQDTGYRSQEFQSGIKSASSASV